AWAERATATTRVNGSWNSSSVRGSSEISSKRRKISAMRAVSAGERLTLGFGAARRGAGFGFRAGEGGMGAISRAPQPSPRAGLGVDFSARLPRPERPMDRLLYMDAEITPNRSLSQRGFVILISLVTVMNCVSAAVFVAIGAHLVPIFLALDVAAIAAAFLVSFAAAKRIERVQVSAADVSVTYETPKDRRLVWRSPTAFTRV